MVEERISFMLAYEETAYSTKYIEDVIKAFNLHEMGTGVSDLVKVYTPGNVKPKAATMRIRKFWATEFNYIDTKRHLDTKFLGHAIIFR